MINLKTGMVVEFCDGDMGIIINNCIYCHDSWLGIDDETLKDMFCEDSTVINSINTIYMPSCKKSLDSLLDKECYTKESEIIWERSLKDIQKGDIVQFASAEIAERHNADTGCFYLYTGDRYMELSDLLIPKFKLDTTIKIIK